MPEANDSRPQILGIDFSGAEKAGRKIWLAEGAVHGETLHITSCRRAADLPDSGVRWTQCQGPLRDFVSHPRFTAVGIDFPFGLPRTIADSDSWIDFVKTFEGRFESPTQFRYDCTAESVRRTGKKELRRSTDTHERTPFSPYNIRLCRQTFFGIRDLLAPLVADNRIRVIPMQEAESSIPVVVEICPASSLERFHLRVPYKKKHLVESRKSLLQRFEKRTGIVVSESVRHSAISDPEGDALDAVIAAEATFRAWRDSAELRSWSGDHLIEGFVFS
jgi:hypothetical protein